MVPLILRRFGLLIGLAVLAVTLAHATDTHDFFNRPDTLAVGLTGGDTDGTYSVKCNFTGTAALMRPAVTNRSRRKVCFENTGNIAVDIGSSTVIASDFYVLGESTNSATPPIYCTNSSAAFYCATSIGVSSMTVVISEETQSIP